MSTQHATCLKPRVKRVNRLARTRLLVKRLQIMLLQFRAMGPALIHQIILLREATRKLHNTFEIQQKLILEFTDGVILPSKEELLSAFSKFGTLIESMSDILEDIDRKSVV